MVCHVWLTLDLMHQPVLGLAAIFLWICLYNNWCYECLDLGPFAQICAQFGILLLEMQQGDDIRHTYRHRLDKFSMFVKKTDFPKLEPLLLINQYDGVSYRGVEPFSVVFFGENEVDAEI